MDLTIIIPCYNEADNIENMHAQLSPVVAELARTRTMEIVLVDDGSSDGTWEAMQRVFPGGGDLPARIRIEKHPHNMGLGAAIRTGFAAASGELLVTTDSDGTFRFDTIPQLLEYLTPEVDLVTASPYHPLGRVVNVPGYRLILSKGSSLIYRILLGGRVYCYTALFRVYRKRVIEEVSFDANGFLAGTEILVKAMLMGFRVAEFPAVLHSRVVGVSKIRTFQTIRSHLSFQSKVLLHKVGLRRLVNHMLAKP